MASFGTISGRQLTVPDEVFDGLGLHDGDRVEFAHKDGEFVLRPAQTDENPFLKWAGALALSPEEYEDWYTGIRGRYNEETGGPEFD